MNADRTRPLRADALEQAPWLRLARRQSLTLAAAREALQAPPLRWQSAEPRTRPAPRRRPRIAWALVIPALMLCGITGTWAFVQHLWIRSAREVTPPVAAPRPAWAPTPAPREPRRRRVGEAAPRGEAREVVERSVPPRVARRRRPTSVAVSAPPPAAPPRLEQTIVIPTLVTGDDQVIIVTPPARLKPLWTLESFKQRGRRSSPPE